MTQMEKKLIKLTEQDLHKIIKEAVRKTLNEAYNSDLYHFTNLEGIYSILEDNCLSAIVTGDDEYDENDVAVCLSRTSNPYIGYSPNTKYDIIFRITLDTEKMLSSIRGMKIKPWSMNNPRTTTSHWNGKKKYISVSDFEERAYTDIFPLDRYCKSIDAFPYTKGEIFDEEQTKILDKLKEVFPQWNKFFGF